MIYTELSRAAICFLFGTVAYHAVGLTWSLLGLAVLFGFLLALFSDFYKYDK